MPASVDEGECFGACGGASGADPLPRERIAGPDGEEGGCMWTNADFWFNIITFALIVAAMVGAVEVLKRMPK